MVRAIVIPALDADALQILNLEALEEYQAVVGGWIEAVDLPTLGCTLYVNEEGLLRRLRINRRATYIWRFHVPGVDGNVRLVGDAVLVGLPDQRGADTDVPPVVERRLLEAGTYRIRTRESGDTTWRPEPVRREDYFETIIWATLLREFAPDAEVQVDEA